MAFSSWTTKHSRVGLPCDPEKDTCPLWDLGLRLPNVSFTVMAPMVPIQVSSGVAIAPRQQSAPSPRRGWYRKVVKSVGFGLRTWAPDSALPLTSQLLNLLLNRDGHMRSLT